MDNALDRLDLGAYAGTPLALETGLADGSTPWATSAAAGLQFYAYAHADDLGGQVMPAPGDRLVLVRAPENPYDGNAVEIWWHNEHQLGHLPRVVAAHLASRIDAGEPVRAYALDPGDGEAWSLVVLLVGQGVEPLHQQRLERIAEERAFEGRMEVVRASAAVWGEERQRLVRRNGYAVYERVPEPAPTTAQQSAACHFEAAQEQARRERRASAIAGFAAVLAERPALPAELVAVAPDAALRGRVFTWWDEVPPTLKTKTAWQECGRKLASGAQPFAAIVYGKGRRHRRHDLYAGIDTVPMKAPSPQALAEAAEAAYRAGRLVVW